MKNKIWIYALVFAIFSFTQCKMDDANANASTITDSTVVAGKDEKLLFRIRKLTDGSNTASRNWLKKKFEEIK